MLLAFHMRCGTRNSNQSKECKCVMELPLIHFNVLIKGHFGISYILRMKDNHS